MRKWTVVPYWPRAGVGFGLLLNTVGLILKDSVLIATGSNILTVSGLFMVQKRRNRTVKAKDEERQ